MRTAFAVLTQDDSGGLSFVISTEQREWRNLARLRISYERLVF